MSDPFLQSNGVLKNRLGITDAQTLSSAESDISSQRLAEIRVGTAPEATRGNFDLDHFKAIHQHTFGDVYEWAGVTRAEPVTIEGETHTQPPLLMKETTVFTPAPQVDEKLTRTFDQLQANDYLRGLSREEFCQKAAEVFSQINEVHAFREGNGRTQREFMTQLSEQAGHPLNFAVVSKERMIVASWDGMQGDNSGLERMFQEISDPPRVAMLERAQGYLDRENVNWQDMYIASATPGQTYQGQVALHDNKVVVMRIGHEVIVGQTKDLQPDALREDGMVNLKATEPSDNASGAKLQRGIAY